MERQVKDMRTNGDLPKTIKNKYGVGGELYIERDKCYLDFTFKGKFRRIEICEAKNYTMVTESIALRKMEEEISYMETEEKWGPAMANYFHKGKLPFDDEK